MERSDLGSLTFRVEGVLASQDPHILTHAHLGQAEAALEARVLLLAWLLRQGADGLDNLLFGGLALLLCARLGRGLQGRIQCSAAGEPV